MFSYNCRVANKHLSVITTAPFCSQIKVSTALKLLPPSNKRRTSKCGSYLKSDHNATETQLKVICKNYTDSEAIKKELE